MWFPQGANPGAKSSSAGVAPDVNYMASMIAAMQAQQQLQTPLNGAMQATLQQQQLAGVMQGMQQPLAGAVMQQPTPSPPPQPVDPAAAFLEGTGIEIRTFDHSKGDFKGKGKKGRYEPYKGKGYKGKGKGEETDNIPKTSGDSFVCMTTAKDHNSEEIRLILGEYHEHSTNHGRKAFHKVSHLAPSGYHDYANGQLAGRPYEGPPIILYYWDERDGEDSRGWWFGNEIGGAQVYVLNKEVTQQPPKTGWKVPWHGEVRETLKLLTKEEWEKAETEERLLKANDLVNQVTQEAQQALVDAQSNAANGTVEGYRTAEAILMPKANEIGQAQKKLSGIMRYSPWTWDQNVKNAMNELASRLRQWQEVMSQEAQKAALAFRQAKAQQGEATKKEEEEKEQKALEELLLSAHEKCYESEMAVDKAQNIAEMVRSSGDQFAAEQTVNAIEEARKAVGEAQNFLNRNGAKIMAFRIQVVRNRGQQEWEKLKQQVMASNSKVQQLQNFEKENKERQEVQKSVDEVRKIFGVAEVKVHRAELAAGSLLPESGEEDFLNAKRSMAQAQSLVAGALKLLEVKLSEAQGVAREELQKLEPKANEIKDRMAWIKTAIMSAADEGKSRTVLGPVTSKVNEAMDAIQKASKSEGEFLHALEEEVGQEEMKAAVKKCDEAFAAAFSLVGAAMKLMISQRGAAGEAGDFRLNELQRELDTSSKKLNEMSKAHAQRRQGVLKSFGNNY